MSSDGADHSEMSVSNVLSRLALAIRGCPCHRPVIGSQIMGSCDRCAAEQTAGEEIMRLNQWKEEATEVIARWDAVADGVPCELGQRRSDAVDTEIKRLRAENQAFRDQFVTVEEIREAFAHWNGTDASLPEGWIRQQRDGGQP